SLDLELQDPDRRASSRIDRTAEPVEHVLARARVALEADVESRDADAPDDDWAAEERAELGADVRIDDRVVEARGGPSLRPDLEPPEIEAREEPEAGRLELHVDGVDFANPLHDREPELLRAEVVAHVESPEHEDVGQERRGEQEEAAPTRSA